MEPRPEFVPIYDDQALRKELEDDDPYELVAHMAPVPPGYDAPGLMARTFIEEFALMGWPRSRILRIFQSAAFAGSHSVYEERGEAYIQGLIDEVFASGRGSSHA